MVQVFSGERSLHMLIGNLNLTFLPGPVEANTRWAVQLGFGRCRAATHLFSHLASSGPHVFPLPRKTVGTELCGACVCVERAVSKSL